MATNQLTIRQDIFKGDFAEISMTTCHFSEGESKIPRFLQTIEDGLVGLAPIYDRQMRLSSLAISSISNVLVVNMPSANKKSKKQGPVLKSALEKFLLDTTIMKSAFEMDKIAAALHLDFHLDINNAKDLLSTSKASRESLQAIMGALGGETTLVKQAVQALFYNEGQRKDRPRIAALQAWGACRASTLPYMVPRLARVITINTATLERQVVKLISKTICDSDRILALKPTRVKHDVDPKINMKSGTLTLTSKRYKTRVMPTAANQSLMIHAAQADGTVKAIKCRTRRVSGKTTELPALKGLGKGEIRSFETIGREAPTAAEVLKACFMLGALQQTISLPTHPFINVMWFPTGKAKQKLLWKDTPTLTGTPTFHFPGPRTLNTSQLKAVNAALSSNDTNRIVLIHGPPGTGKTTVIAATVTSTMCSLDQQRTLWLVAQSNVAVKNIAEKLASIDFVNFKVLVSKDFHFDWHEHLYHKIEHNVLRSDDFPEDLIAAERQLLGSRVILCTLSMLSNEKMRIFTHLVPIQTVIFDEASQIEIGDYFPVLIQFRPTLRKLVFIGDDKQLAPYGSSDVPTLESIFEKSHLRGQAIFLDTQYRMPLPIGDFISKHVYDGKLRSNHAITSTSSCRFVDVCDGVELSHGRSWKNLREVKVVIGIARQLTRAKKSFRIITPYDPQRSALENGLKDAKLPWEDKCFNIDAFQGNEDDYIIVSLVRSAKLGFLSDVRRVNVMLTRCKKGMIICSSRTFLAGPAARTLVGEMFANFGKSNMVEGARVLLGQVRPFD